jgi:hypothetical protein
MTNRKKVGQERCLQKVHNQALNDEQYQNTELDNEKSSSENCQPTGFLEMLSILRMSLKKAASAPATLLGQISPLWQR